MQEFNLFEPIEEQITKAEEKKKEEAKRKNEIEEMRKKAAENPTPKNSKKKKKENFKGVREVKVYGNVVYTEEDPKVSDDQIRQTLVNEFGYGELTKEITAFNLVVDPEDKERAILLVGPTFNKKG